MCCSIAFFTENDIAWGLGLGVTALLIIVIPAIFTPYCYIFDNEGVSLCYVFLPCERYLWNDVYAIEVQDTSTTTDVFDLLFAYVFKIKGIVFFGDFSKLFAYPTAD